MAKWPLFYVILPNLATTYVQMVDDRLIRSPTKMWPKECSF